MQAADTRERAGVVEYGLEVVVLPVSDTDKAKDFYQGLGCRLDADFAGGPDRRDLGLAAAAAFLERAAMLTPDPGRIQEPVHRGREPGVQFARGADAEEGHRPHQDGDPGQAAGAAQAGGKRLRLIPPG